MAALETGMLEPGDARWEAALAVSPHDVYHLPAYVELCARHETALPRAFWAAEGGRNLLVPLLVRPLPDLPAADPSRFDATSPYGYAAPVLGGERGSSAGDFLERALDAFVALLAGERIVSAFVRLHPLLPLPLDALAGRGRLVQHGETVSIDVTRPEADMWRGVRSDHRKDINRAARQGQVARMDDAWVHLDGFVEVYHQTMRRTAASDFYFFPRDYFVDLRRALGPRLHLAVIEIGGELAGAGLVTETDGIVQNHLSGTHDAFTADSPEKARVDFVRRWAAARGDRVLHLGGGVGGRADSLFAFKAGFSPQRHPFFTWRVVADGRAYTELVMQWERRAGSCADGDEAFFPAYRRPAP